MMNSVSIANRQIGPEHPPYIIAELSGNHNGDIRRANALLEAAKEAGADAVKLQTYTADTITIDHDGPQFIIKGGPWHGRKLHELYREAHTPWEWHEALFVKARELGLTIFSSPFDRSAIQFLERLNAPAYKIASFELIDLPLIGWAAATGKPLIMSTGMANTQEIEEAVSAARAAGGTQLVLLHCVSAYPAGPEEANVRTIADLARRYDVVAGLSDHTLGIEVAVAAVAMGAAVIEKHLTLRRADGGPDAGFSLEPEEFKSLCQGCKNAWLSLGQVHYGYTDGEQSSVMFRRSLYVVQDMKVGDTFTEETIRSIRPGYGLPPKFYGKILGRAATRAIARGTPLDWNLIK